MASPVLRERLDRLGFAAGLAPAQLDRLAEVAAPVAWGAGEFVFREGAAEPDPRLFLVEEGLVNIEVTVPGRGPVTILSTGPGELFGWSSLFDTRPKAATARAAEPTRALALDAARLRALCDADAGLGYAVARRILSVVSERLTAARMQLLDLYR